MIKQQRQTDEELEQKWRDCRKEMEGRTKEEKENVNIYLNY